MTGDCEQEMRTVEGEVVGTPRISEGQQLKKVYKNCRSTIMVDGDHEPGRYVIVRVDGER